jgi:DNA repair exonuclease SbcCD ATPase subunit
VAQLADAAKQLSALKTAHRKLEAEAACAQEAERSRDAFTNSCNERVEALEAQLGDAHRDIAVLRDRLALAQQQQQQQALLPQQQQQHVSRGTGGGSGEGWHVAGASRGEAGGGALVQGGGRAGGADGGVGLGISGLQAELLEARGRVVEAQQRALEYADEMRAMRGELERLQRLFADQHTQLESVTAVNLYCLQRAAAVEALERSVSELASQKRQAEQERDAALRDVKHLRIQVSPPHLTVHSQENGTPAPREGKPLGRRDV